MKVLNPTVHGVLDYLLALAFLVLPAMLGFSEPAARLAHMVGLFYIAAALLTRYPLGLFKLIPFPVHGVLESIMALAWIACPWLFRFSDNAPGRNFFIVAGIG